MAVDLNAAYGHKFLCRNIAASGSSALTLATSLYNMFQPKSIIDMGSGAGCLINAFATYGGDCVAVDGGESGKLLLKPEIRFIQHDFRTPFVGLKKFDLVVCFEVIEHIEAKCEHILLDGLLSLTGKALAFTAAPDNHKDGHTQHVNLRPREYWLQQLVDRGFKYEADLTAVLQKGWQQAGTASFYPNNLIVCSNNFFKPHTKWENISEWGAPF